jgi:hypothetical protein
MRMEAIAKITSSGYEVGVTAHGKFVIEGVDRLYDTAEQAAEAAERKEKAEQKNNQEKLALKAISGTGIETTITGIHAGHGTLLHSKAKEIEGKRDWLGGANYTGSIFPDTPEVRAIVAEKCELRRRTKAIDSILGDLVISDRPGIGQHEFLKKEYEDNLKKAKEARLPS